uniref:Uncharacterized protein n=1 Tax=Tanacetum cinerariifolium TaxID=118510 RepID=A0A699J048_TANCI|nr:hypothetical protein [Tanacetum cinerariifolium]
MASLPKCWALQERVGGWEWVDIMVLNCQSSAELEYVPGVIAAVKMAEFLNKKLWIDDRRLQKLRNIEIVAEEMAFDKDRFIQNL